MDRVARFLIVDQNGKLLQAFPLEIGARLKVEEGQWVQPGVVLAVIERDDGIRTPIGSYGLARLPHLLEMRPNHKPMELAEFDGTVEFASHESATHARLVILHGDNGQTKSYPIRSNKRLRVTDGQRVIAGDPLANGSPSLIDILRILGPEAAKRYLLFEVQQVFRDCRSKMLDQQLELIVAQLFRLQDPCDPNSLVRLTPLSLVKWRRSELLTRVGMSDPTSVLTQAALTGEIDTLSGLRSNCPVVNEDTGTSWDCYFLHCTLTMISSAKSWPERELGCFP